MNVQSVASELIDSDNFNTVVSTGNVITNDDGDGQTITVTAVDGEPVNGSTPITGDYGILVIGSDGAYSYTPNEDASGIDQTDDFVYTINDGNGNTDTATLSIAINSDGQAPAAGRMSFSSFTLADDTDDAIELPDISLITSSEGLDILSFEGSDQVVSLADLIQPDVIDISGIGANTLTVQAADIANSGVSTPIYIKGDGDDTVDLGGIGADLNDKDESGNPSTWIDTGNDVTDTAGQQYNVWQLDNDITTQVYIDIDVTNVI